MLNRYNWTEQRQANAMSVISVLKNTNFAKIRDFFFRQRWRKQMQRPSVRWKTVCTWSDDVRRLSNTDKQEKQFSKKRTLQKMNMVLIWLRCKSSNGLKLKVPQNARTSSQRSNQSTQTLWCICTDALAQRQKHYDTTDIACAKGKYALKHTSSWST